MMVNEPHACIGCGVYITTHRSQLCIACRSGGPGRLSVTQTQWYTGGASIKPPVYVWDRMPSSDRRPG